LQILGHLNHAAVGGNNGLVGSAKMLASSLRNRAHTLTHGHVLMPGTRDAGEVPFSLHFTVNQEVIFHGRLHSEGVCNIAVRESVG
jgi:hypothetical protein